MRAEDIIARTGVVHGLRAARKLAVLEDLSRRAGQALDLDSATVLSALRKREELGSTGVGDGIGLPHARLDRVAHPFGILASLRSPVDFGAVDERPVDLVCLLLLPATAQNTHLNALACVARRLRDPGIAGALRDASDADALYAAMCSQTLTQA